MNVSIPENPRLQVTVISPPAQCSAAPPSRPNDFFKTSAGFIVWIIACLTLGLGGLRAATEPPTATGPGYREWALPKPTGTKPGFTLMSPESLGIRFTNFVGVTRSATNRNLLSGSGVAAGDVDGDGRVDLFFCGMGGASRLYANRGGMRFEDITVAAGVALPDGDATGAVLVDVDGDGDLDLLVNLLGGGTRLFLNDGKGHFHDATRESGLASLHGGMSMALADVDGNGTLDLYVCNFAPSTIRDQVSPRIRAVDTGGRPRVVSVNDRPTTDPDLTNRYVITANGSVLEYSQEHDFYLNDGHGRFTRVPFTGGAFLDEDGKPLTQAPLDWGLAAQFHDVNGDGVPDLYVCNDLFTPDRFWINDGHGRFRAADRLALRHMSSFSMGVDFGDLNHSGNVDFFVVDMLSRDHQRRHVQVAQMNAVQWPVGVIDDRPQLSRNTLQVGRGDGTFADLAYFSGLEASEWSWGPIFVDVDLDGWLDILVANGQLRDFQNMDVARALQAAQAGRQLTQSDAIRLQEQIPKLETSKLAFRNLGGYQFSDQSEAWGLGGPGISQGMCLADLDGDGDLDLIVNNLNAVASVYRNETIAPRVAVRLKGRAPNTSGVGAVVTLKGGGAPIQSQERISGGRYLSGDDALQVFAAGTGTGPLSLDVRWRSGTISHVEVVRANHLYEIEEPSGSAPMRVVTAETVPKPWFEDVTGRLNHSHTEEPFDDFERQPLLPRRLSQLGPAVAWHDIDGDGWEDLVIGTGRGGAMGVFTNDTRGGFVRLDQPSFNRLLQRDQAGIVSLDGTLIAGSSNYEDGLTNGGWVRIYDLARKVAGESIAGQTGAPGPLALADVDGDGTLDLFIGGRVIAGRYPEAPPSVLLHSEAGHLVPQQKFTGLGMVSGAVFTDLDGDGRPELVVACEWGPIRVLRWDGHQYVEITQALGLGAFTGWWNSVAAGDFDGDGRMDLIAGNWGLNSPYHASGPHPVKLYFGDLAETGALDLVEAVFEPTLSKEVPIRGLRSVGAALPWVGARMPTFAHYGESGLPEIFGDRIGTVPALEVNTLESMVFLNRGDHFEAHPLPAEAQWAPVFGVSVADADGDGKEDVFLAQNFFAVNPEMHRLDAGRGLWLRGDGTGKFEAVSGQVSGVKVYGEQRASAVADFDHDGRTDLVVTQNGAATRLYRNVGARPGLRVRLEGPAKNRRGVGAVLRLKTATWTGPAREIHAGSGYWSQDAAVTVLSRPPGPLGSVDLIVRWPGGRTTTVPVGSSETSVAVRPDEAAAK